MGHREKLLEQLGLKSPGRISQKRWSLKMGEANQTGKMKGKAWGETNMH